jgi:hypothetical protein
MQRDIYPCEVVVWMLTNINIKGFEDHTEELFVFKIMLTKVSMVQSFEKNIQEDCYLF